MNDKKTILYRPQEVCRLLSISYPTLLKYIHKGSLQAIRIGSQWRINRAELERFIGEGNFDVTMNLKDLDV